MNSDNQLIFKDEPNTNALALSSVIVVVLIAVVCYILPPYIKIIKNGDFPDVFTQRFLFLVIALIGIPSFLYSIFKPRPPLTVDQENIYYNNQIIPFKNIKHINAHLLSGSSKTNEGSEAVEIILKNNETLIVKIGDYGNGAFFRTICDKISSNLAKGIYTLEETPVTEAVVIDSPTEVVPDSTKFDTFLGNPLFTFSFWFTIFTWGMGITMLFQHKSSSFNGPFGMALFAVLGLALAYPLNYFLVAHDYLVVRHHIYFWKKVVIPMKNIKRISTSFSGNSGYGYAIELLTSDYKTRYYYTDRLFRSNLNDLIDKVNTYIDK